MDVLVIGSGGREHAIAWALAKSPNVAHIWVAPGNAGTQASLLESQVPSKISNLPISSDDIPELCSYAQRSGIDLTVVGPEVPLANGVVDAFQRAGLRIFGPAQAAAKLESSKAFAKEFMQSRHIPTAAYKTCSDYQTALAWVREFDQPVVVKADGLAAGKGVIICDTFEDAAAALKRCMVDHEFGAASETVVIEERLTGREVSILAFSDGRTLLTMPPARDHKRIFDDDVGPNTGGMGAYAPVPDVSAELVDEVKRTVLQPTIDGMAALGTPYTGVLYAGIMLTPDGPRTLEFNCRFGDPETQVILPMLKTDLLDILQACVDGTLADASTHVQWHKGVCATVVASAPGYPGSYTKGLPISGLSEASKLPDVFVFHAGTKSIDQHVVSSGGRVLSVSALGRNMRDALDRAYDGMSRIQFEGMHYRRDIGVMPECADGFDGT